MILIDIGLSRVYDGIGKVGCLVIEGDQVYVLHRGTRLELPTDTGKDLLRYLKQAAALDPAPSPFEKRIAELEMRLGAGAGSLRWHARLSRFLWQLRISWLEDVYL